MKIFLLTLALFAAAEDRVLISVNNETKEIHITSYYWSALRAANPGVSDARIWAAVFKQGIPQQFQSPRYKNFGMTLSAYEKIHPRSFERQWAWRWSDSTKKVYDDLRLRFPPWCENLLTENKKRGLKDGSGRCDGWCAENTQSSACLEEKN